MRTNPMTIAACPAVRFGPRISAVDISWETLRWASLIYAVLACAAFGGSWTAGSGHPQVATMAAIMLAALLSSIGGFAFSAICGAMLFHLLPNPVQVVQIMIVCSIVNQAAMTWTLRRDIDWRLLPKYLAGGIAGVPLGVWVLLHADRTTYTPAFGVLLTAYGLWMILRRPVTLRVQHSALDMLSGFLSGITGGATGFPSSFLTVWVGFKGWDKRRQRALFQPFILITQLLALAAIALTKPAVGHGGGIALTDLLYLPGSLLGTAIGMTLFRRLSDTQFTRVVNVMLLVCGLSYIV